MVSLEHGSSNTKTERSARAKCVLLHNRVTTGQLQLHWGLLAADMFILCLCKRQCWWLKYNKTTSDMSSIMAWWVTRNQYWGTTLEDFGSLLLHASGALELSIHYLQILLFMVSVSNAYHVGKLASTLKPRALPSKTI